MATSDCFVSVVAPVHNEAGIVEAFIAEVMAILEAHYANYELVMVDDGSDDRTAEIISTLLGRYRCIRLIRLSRRFGNEIAIASGLDSVIGDFVVVISPDSDQPQLIPKMIAQARAGSGIVFGVREDRAGEPFLMRMAAGFFYWCSNNLFGLNLPKNSTEFRVLSRQAVNAITQIKDKYRYLRLFSAHIGYATQSFSYKPINRHGRPKRRGFLESVNLATNILISSSAHPLRIVSWLGLFASFLNVLYVCYILLVYFYKAHVAEGWTTLSLQTAGMFFLVFLILAVLGEYVGRILEESKDRPLYHVLEEKTSSTLLIDPERRNVVKESVPTEPIETKSD